MAGTSPDTFLGEIILLPISRFLLDLPPSFGTFMKDCLALERRDSRNCSIDIREVQGHGPLGYKSVNVVPPDFLKNQRNRFALQKRGTSCCWSLLEFTTSQPSNCEGEQVLNLTAACHPVSHAGIATLLSTL